MLGTAAYLAPELVRGEPAGSAADIYALGLVLLEALTGTRPFAEAIGIGTLTARLFTAPPIPSEPGPGWAGLLRAMTATDPARRPTALDVMNTAVALRGLGTARPVPPGLPATAPRDILGPLPPVDPIGALHAIPRARHGRARSRRRPAVIGGCAAAVIAPMLAAALTLATAPFPRYR